MQNHVAVTIKPPVPTADDHQAFFTGLEKGTIRLGHIECVGGKVVLENFKGHGVLMIATCLICGFESRLKYPETLQALRRSIFSSENVKVAGVGSDPVEFLASRKE